MEIQYLGASAVKITTKNSVTLFNPISDIAKLNTDLKKATCVIITQDTLSISEHPDNTFLITGPGEYELTDSSIKGVAVQPHTGSAGDKSATMYRYTTNDINILFVGHVDDKHAESQLEEIGVVDIMIVPVGGGGYTLDSVGAANLVRAVEPRLVIPVHYNDGLQYDVPQQELELFIKELGTPVAEDQPDKLKIKSLPEQLTVQVIKRS